MIKQYKVTALYKEEDRELVFFIIADDILEAYHNVLKTEEMSGMKLEIISIQKEKEYSEGTSPGTIIGEFIDKNFEQLKKDFPIYKESDTSKTDTKKDEIEDAIGEEDNSLPYNERDFSQKGKEILYKDFSEMYLNQKDIFNKEIDNLLSYYVDLQAWEKAAYIKSLKQEIIQNNG